MQICVNEVRKTYGRAVAVDDVSFDVLPGRVTGFLGPNGAGKSTTMRMILGLDRPDRGTITIGGRRYDELAEPLHEIGALLEARAVHPGRSARNHLLYLARSNGIPDRRVDELLGLVGLERVANRPVKTFSLGMGQRLGIATALLGDPAVLLLDEPVNGLDVEGIRWIRAMLRDLAAQGRAVLLSSHLLGEMSVTADHLVVIRKGRLIADCSTAEFLARGEGRTVHVKSPDLAELLTTIKTSGGTAAADKTRRNVAAVTGLTSSAVGRLAAANGFVLEELMPSGPSLEETFLELTTDSADANGSAMEANIA